MSIDISTRDYSIDIGHFELDLIRSQTRNMPMFTRLLTVGCLSSKEAGWLLNECMEMDHKVITSSGKEFYPELVKLIRKSIDSGEDVIVHGIFKDSSVFNMNDQRFWGVPVSEQEIIVKAMAPKDFSKAKWELINIGLTDDCNTYIRYAPVLTPEGIAGLRCGIFKKDTGKTRLRKELQIMINKLCTFKFILTLEKTNEAIDKANYMDRIVNA